MTCMGNPVMLEHNNAWPRTCFVTMSSLGDIIMPWNTYSMGQCHTMESTSYSRTKVTCYLCLALPIFNTILDLLLSTIVESQIYNNTMFKK